MNMRRVCMCVCVGAHLLMNAILRSEQPRQREIVQGSLGGWHSGEERRERG